MAESSRSTLVVWRPRFYRAITSRSPEDWDLPSESTLLRFELFPDLPLELRQMIYNHTVPEPRIIQFGTDQTVYSILSTELQTIQLGTLTNEYDEPDSNPFLAVINTSKVHTGNEGIVIREVDVTTPKASDGATKLPWALLAVNKEARGWAKKRYRLSFQTGLAIGNGGIYVDFSRDTLSFNSAYSLKLFCDLISIPLAGSNTSNESQSLLDEVAILPQKIAVKGSLGDLNYKHLAQFENLKLLSVLKSLPRSWRGDYFVKEKWYKTVLTRNRSSPGNGSGGQTALGGENAKASSVAVGWQLPQISEYKLRGYRDRFWPLF